MRFVVLFLGLIGCALTAIAAALFLANKEVEQQARTILGEPAKTAAELLEEKKKNKDYEPSMVAVTLDRIFGSLGGTYKERIDTGIFLLLAAILGTLGTLLAVMRCGWQGAVLLFVPLIGAALFNFLTLLPTSVQALAGITSVLFVRPLPIQPPEEQSEEEDD